MARTPRPDTRAPRPSLAPPRPMRATERAALNVLLTSLHNYPVLDAAQERALLLRARAGDATARETLILSNIRIAVRAAQREAGYGYPLDELVRDAITQLMIAVDRFDPDKGASFTTYAVLWMSQYVARARKRMTQLDPLSLDAPVGDSTSVPLHATIADPRDDIQDAENKIDVANLLTCLTPRERFVIECYFGLDNQPRRRLEEIGEMLGVTREWVRQIKCSALRKMHQRATTGTNKDTGETPCQH